MLTAAGESLTLEFKRGKARALNDDTIVEAVVCLANGSGGLLLLGVEDDGRITGLDPRHGTRTEPHLLQAMILNKTEAPLPPTSRSSRWTARPSASSQSRR